MPITAAALAARFIGVVQEQPGSADDPFIVWCLSRVGLPAQHDEVPWCSAFANAIAWMLDLPHSGKANARSWLEVGRPVALAEAAAGMDVVVLRRGTNPAAGHVGFFFARGNGTVSVLGGNQSNGVSVVRFPESDVLDVRRLQ